MIYIIADDLTGATDTGVQFSKQGYNTHVVIVSESEPHSLTESFQRNSDIDVLVLDTETREADVATARNRIKQILQEITPYDDDMVYKKVDSTLRGNIGVELDECMRMLKKELCIFAPSFPSNRRVTIGGYLIVQDQPLGLSEYYNGQLEPGDASFIPSLLRQDTDFSIARIDLKEVLKGQETILHALRELHAAGNKVIVVDAIHEEQLQLLLKSCLRFEESILYAGSAGLANSFSTIYHGKRHAKMAIAKNQRAVFIVSGSRRTIVQRQIEYVKNAKEIVVIPIDIKQIFSNRGDYLTQCVTQASQALYDNRHTVVHPDPLYHEKSRYQELLSTYALNFRELELTLRKFLGELVAKSIGNAPVYNIIITGGDTALGVCSALQIKSLRIVNELLPGIPLSVGYYNDIPLNIVTKAGGFGEENTLYTLLDKLVSLSLQNGDVRRPSA